VLETTRGWRNLPGPAQLISVAGAALKAGCGLWAPTYEDLRSVRAGRVRRCAGSVRRSSRIAMQPTTHCDIG
jgi:hypothetical protein